MKEYTFRDPVHGDITVQDPVILGLIDAPEFQRLRRIRQLGTSFISYPGAEHTRFAHSLGVYHLLQRVLRHFTDHKITAVDPEERLVAAAAALLHDVGHGPFSHLFEKVTGAHHEGWVQQIILSPDTTIHQRLAAMGTDWPARVAGLLAGEWTGAPYLRGLLAGQLDVDRMDYLLRDSLMCGVPYGRFDLDRLISCLRIHDTGNGRAAVVVHRKGQSAAEAFILARYFMYWNVYFHKATRSSEVILEKVLQRALALHRAGQTRKLGGVPPAIVRMLTGELSLAEYLQIDEVDCQYAIKQWMMAPDRVLSDLSRRFVQRRLLKGIPINGQLDYDLHAAVLRVVAQAGFREPEYYVQVDRAANIAYSYYVRPQGGGPQPVLILDDPDPHAAAGAVVEISRRSDVLKSITEKSLTRHVLFVPKEAGEAVLPLLGRQLLFEV